jgi:hypothetical protein
MLCAWQPRIFLFAGEDGALGLKQADVRTAEVCNAVQNVQTTPKK